MKYSKIIGVLVVAALLAVPFLAISGDKMAYTQNTLPWTFDTYLSGVTTTGASTQVVVSHVYSPVSNYSCVISLATSTSHWLNISLEGSLDGTTYYNVLSTPTISINPSSAALLSAVTYTLSTGKPALYTRMVYSQVSYSTLIGQGATAVTGKCLATN